MDRRLIAIAMFGLVAASGCSLADNTGYKAGELGNGGFYFSCDDAVSCAEYSNDAKKFPETVSLGSTFRVRFVSQSTSSKASYITFNESAPNRGLTVNPIGEYLSFGPKGMLAQKEGYATIFSRDAAGQLVDYINVQIVKPDALVVYAADDVSASPTRIDAVKVSLSDRRSLRAFARQNKKTLAGSLQVEWTSSSTAFFDVDTSDGKAVIVPKKAGQGTLVAVGGTFKQEIPVEVTP